MYKNNSFQKEKLRNFVDINLGQSPSSDSYCEKEEGVDFFQGVSEFGDKYPTAKKYTNQPKKIATENSVLMSVRAPVGEINIAKNDCCIGRGLAGLNSENNTYLAYLLKYHRKDWERIQKGVIFSAVNKADIEDFEVFYTTNKVEQDKIVSIIDQQQGIIDSYKEKLSLLEEQEAYYQDELLSGRLRIRLTDESINYATQQGWYLNDDLVEGKEKEFEEWITVDFHSKIEFYKETDFIAISLNGQETLNIPKEWSCLKLNNILNGVVGMTPPKKDPNNYNGDMKWINISDFGEYFIDAKKTINPECKGVANRIIEKGSLLYSFKLSVGLMGFSKYDNMMTNEAIISFKPSKNENLDYFYHILKKYLHKNAGVNAFGAPIMNQEKIKQADLVLTEIITERILIKEFFKLFKNQKDLIKEKIKVEEEKMDYLMDELLSGRIRVK
tara:strand:- start:7190 stop:8515 length:1326 start_codon:yes stop_codon:yes gene_type:complete